MKAILRDMKQLQDSLPIHPDSAILVRQVTHCNMGNDWRVMQCYPVSESQISIIVNINSIYFHYYQGFASDEDHISRNVVYIKNFF